MRLWASRLVRSESDSLHLKRLPRLMGHLLRNRTETGRNVRRRQLLHLAVLKLLERRLCAGVGVLDLLVEEALAALAFSPAWRLGAAEVGR